MDLTITLEGNKIVTTLYEKPNNLHLFIPSKSCHPPGLLRGMINGHVYRIRKLCTHPPDQLEKLQRYFRCLLARGYDRDLLRRLFYEACSKKRAKKSSDKNRLFFHIRYHPKNISPRTIQMSWRNTIQSSTRVTSIIRRRENAYTTFVSIGSFASYKKRDIGNCSTKTVVRNYKVSKFRPEHDIWTDGSCEAIFGDVKKAKLCIPSKEFFGNRPTEVAIRNDEIF